MNAPSSTTQILDLALDMEANEVIIGGVRFKPCGTGTDHPEVAADDARAIYDTLSALRNECYEWRHYAVRINGWVGKFPAEPRTKL